MHIAADGDTGARAQPNSSFDGHKALNAWAHPDEHGASLFLANSFAGGPGYSVGCRA